MSPLRLSVFIVKIAKLNLIFSTLQGKPIVLVRVFILSLSYVLENRYHLKNRFFKHCLQYAPTDVLRTVYKLSQYYGELVIKLNR